MSLQAILSMPLSFAIVLIAAFVLSGPGAVHDVADDVTGPGTEDQDTVAITSRTVPVDQTEPVQSTHDSALVPDPPPPVPQPPVPVADPPVAIAEPPATGDGLPAPTDEPPALALEDGEAPTLSSNK